jgi:hypothetical protein
MQQDYEGDYWRLAAWSMDFVRCVEEKSKFRRFLLFLVLGKYAAREYVGIREELERESHPYDFGYGLEHCTYHKEKWNWFAK